MSQIRTAFYTESHRIEGELLVVERLSERLNDPLTNFIELNKVRIVGINQPIDAPAVSWPTAAVPKSTILLATLDTAEHESRETRVDKKRSKTGSQVGAIVGTVEAYGTAHLQFTGAPSQILSSQLQTFFPLTDATLVLGGREQGVQITTGLALINREKVRALTMI